MHNSETEEHYRKRKYLKNSNSGGGGKTIFQIMAI